MKYIKFMTVEFLLFSTLIIFNFYAGDFLGPPFTHVDFIAIILYFAGCYILYKLFKVLFNRIGRISLKVKITLSIVTFLLAVVFLVLVESFWSAAFGKMLFS